MNLRMIWLLIGISLLVVPKESSALDFFFKDKFVMKVGDDLRWADPAFDDYDWSPISFQHVSEMDDIVWLRGKVVLKPGQTREGHPLGIYFAALASHETYWDGELIGRSGKPGRTPQEEIPGRIETHFVVPERLAKPGEHMIAIRTSAHHRHFQPVSGYWLLLIGDYDALLDTHPSWIALIALSGMLLVTLFALTMFITDRSDRSYLLLAILGFLTAALLIAETWRNIFGYTYNWHLLRLVMIVALTFLLNLALLLFVIIRFPDKLARWFILLALLGMSASLFIPQWDVKSLGIFLTGLSLALVWTVHAAFEKRNGSLQALTGLFVTGIALVWQPGIFADLTVYFAVDFLLLCLLISHALQVRQVRNEREEALLKSARLEIQLLKQHIQPHFLLNTLTALSQWIEEDPKTAVRMIQSIAEEFRILAEVSNRPLVSVKDELQLCQSHLEIMSQRKGREFSLAAEGIRPEWMIPPAVLHTLVENAVTHGLPSGKVVEFKLKATEGQKHISYVFEAPYYQKQIQNTVQEGTGLRYIKARLQETYGSDWTLNTGPENDVWKTEIRVPASR